VHVSEWEYRVEEIAGAGLGYAKLRSLGKDGWELVSEVVLPDPKAWGGYWVRATFKKPRR